MGISCTTCGSANIQHVSVVHENGLSHIDTTTRGNTIGVGGYGAGGGVFSATTQGTRQSIASMRAAPPESMPYLLPLVGIMCFCGIVPILLALFGANLVGVIIQLSWIPLSIIWILYARHYNGREYPALFEAWNRSWYCRRCGTIFQSDLQ
jgi:hypothetical protein